MSSANKEKELNKTINEYVFFYEHLHKCSQWHLYLKALLLSFTQSILQEGLLKQSKIRVFKTVLVSCFFKTIAKVKKGEANVIYFWPFQFLHCDFIVPLIKELDIKCIPYKVFVIRQNLLPYLQKKGVSASLITFDKAINNPATIITNLYEMIRFLFSLITSSELAGNRSNIFNSLIHISLINNIQAAIKKIAISNSNQFHFVGYDMSILGRTIIHETNLLSIHSGRIQNGAPNNLILGYSEVSIAFLWDNIAERAYKDYGYAGETVIVGNTLLYEKNKNGFNKEWIAELFNSATAAGIKFFVALSGPGYNTNETVHFKIVELIYELAFRHSSNIFIIKLHPKDSLRHYESLNSLKNVCFIDGHAFASPRPDALDILHFCDVLITEGSTVAIDAFCLNKPVIRVDPFNELDHLKYLMHSLCIKYSNKNQVDEIINEIERLIFRVRKQDFSFENPVIKILAKIKLFV